MTALSQLQEQVRAAISASSPLCIVGGDSKRHLGREPVGETLDVAGYSGVVEYQPTELVITVRAGTSISELQNILAERDQWLACDPPEFGGKATVGGSLACNQSGPARPWQGSIRDHVLGIRLINGKGEHLQFGGQVMKNVAGYDVSRLQAGAMGTFGLITEVSLKVMPRPEASITVRRRADIDDAIGIMNEIGTSPTPLTGACWHDGSLYLRLSGPSAVIEVAAAELSGETHSEDLSFWTLLREQQLPFFDTSSDWWRFSVRPNSAHAKPEGDWLINWNGAERWLKGQYDREELERIASRCGGEVTWSGGGDRHAERLPSVSKSKRALLISLKQAFDPAGVFNPGRLYSWL